MQTTLEEIPSEEVGFRITEWQRKECLSVGGESITVLRGQLNPARRDLVNRTVIKKDNLGEILPAGKYNEGNVVGIEHEGEDLDKWPLYIVMKPYSTEDIDEGDWRLKLIPLDVDDSPIRAHSMDDPKKLKRVEMKNESSIITVRPVSDEALCVICDHAEIPISESI